MTRPRVDNEDANVPIGCNVPEAHKITEKRVAKSNRPCTVRTLGWTFFVPYRGTTKYAGIIDDLSSKHELEA